MGSNLPRTDAKGTEVIETGCSVGNNLGESEQWSVKFSGDTVINLQEHLHNRSGQGTIKDKIVVQSLAKLPEIFIIVPSFLWVFRALGGNT